MGYFEFENGKTPLNATNLMAMQKGLLELVFPKGATYITQEDVNPSNILGFGTWERTKGKVFVGLDENDTNFNEIGKTGGETTHTLTIDEMPSHRHGLNTSINSTSFGTHNSVPRGNGGTEEVKNDELYMKSAGKNQPHNNLQPYEVVGYMWIRRA